ncbi:MAG: deoxynucleoside kinase [Anaerolineales bacterium]|jgi:deoxyadenosine/deoxycytidine kinase
MGKIIAVVGTTGVGKTALVRALCKQGSFVPGLEQHKERPFQQVFKANPNYALPNQIDYLLLRAEQERVLRQAEHTGLVDGGLDLDYHGFTRLFYSRGWLSKAEYNLCKRFYEFIRFNLPPPDLIIHLTASPEVIFQRLAGRKRINIVDPKDIVKLASYLNIWLSTIPPSHLLRLDVSEDDPGYRRLLPALLPKLLPYHIE